jgi:hypothetical protein
MWGFRGSEITYCLSFMSYFSTASVSRIHCSEWYDDSWMVNRKVFEEDDYERGHKPRSYLVNMRMVICLRIPTTFWTGGRTTCYVRQIEIHTAEPLVLDPSPFEVEITIAKLKRYKSPGSDQIPSELIQAGGEILRSKVNKLIKSIWNKEELPEQCKSLLLYQFTRRARTLTVVIIVGYHSYQLPTKFYPICLTRC